MTRPDSFYADRATELCETMKHSDLTEKMIDAPRCFLLGLELGANTLQQMRAHLNLIGDDYSCWPEWAKTENGHITKAGKAILIWMMMESAATPSDGIKHDDI